MRKALICVVLNLFCIPLLAQVPGNLIFRKDPLKEKSLLEAIDGRYQKDVSALNGPHKKDIAGVYKERIEMIREKFTEGEIITDTAASSYLNRLLQQITRSNPSFSTADLRVLFSRAWWPNASSMGEGTVLFNIGLFNRLQSEAQAAFVLCHELAHYFLDHGNHTIRRYVAAVNDESFQKSLKEIRKSEYRQNQQVENLLTGVAFKSRRHSREFEQAADSMALVLLKSTGYDLEEALGALALLDSADRDKHGAGMQLSSRFDFTAYRFKKSWLQSDALMFSIQKDDKDQKEKAREDSLKTHPDCKARIARLRTTVEQWNRTGNKKFLVSAEQFERLKGLFDLEVLAYSFDRGRVSQCLYYALQLSEAYPDNAYAHAMVGRCLNEIYIRQKAHELGKIVDLPGPAYKEGYNSLLQMIQNLRLSEVASLSYHYLQQRSFQFEKDPAFAAAWRTAQEHYRK